MSDTKTRNTANSNSTQDKEEELLRNATTTNDQQPPNKFILNTKKVSGKPLPAPRNESDKMSYENVRLNKKDSSNVLNTKMLPEMKRQASLETENIDSSRCLQQLEDFSKKKLERDQEIMEIQDMLNKMKSPHKNSERSSQDSQNDAQGVNSPKEGEESQTTKNILPEERDKKDVPYYGRCKTELQLVTDRQNSANYRVARRDTVRSGSSTAVLQKPRSKSSQWPSGIKEKQTNKKIGYNPEEARRYMEMQRKQRKSVLYKDPSIKSKIEKEEIKKRLEELKTNSRKLIAKNIQKKEKIMGQNVTNIETESIILKTKSQEQEQNKELMRETKKSSTDLQLVKQHAKVSSQNITTQRSRKESMVQGATRRSLSSQGTSNILKPATTPLLPNQKRVGLLRKTENDKDFSFTSHRSYNFDKENKNIELLTKQLMTPQENKIHIDRNNTHCNELEKKNSEKSKEHVEDEPNADLKVQDNNTRTTIVDGNKKPFISNDTVLNSDPKPNELPYWLRPSATQVYPYNFIMAVRRKLESIAQPITPQETTTSVISQSRQKKRKSLELLLEEKQSKKLKRKREKPEHTKLSFVDRNINQHCTTKDNAENMILNECENKQQDKKLTKENANNQAKGVATSITQFEYLEKSIQHTDFHDIEQTHKTMSCGQTRPLKHLQKSLQSLSSAQEDYKQNLHQLKLIPNNKSMESLNSEINSNLSSISLPIPISNTLTEVSSLRTESRRTLTNPMKQPEDDVASLFSQLSSSSEKNFPKVSNDFEFAKPRAVSPLSLEKVYQLKIERKQSDKCSENEMDFTLLLEDFNRSLSQVIQVNEQLKSSLDKSQQILSPRSSKISSETDKHYSSDFEKSTTSKDNDKLKQTLEKNNGNIMERKRELFAIAGKIKPLLTPQKLSTGEQTLIPINKEIQTLPSLDLKSLTNSSANTEDEEQKTPQTGIANEEQTSCSIASQPYEERLLEIEKLKETLKRTILESKKKRKEGEKKRENSNEMQTINVNETENESLKFSSRNRSKLETKNFKNPSEIPCEIELQSKENASDLDHVFNIKEMLKDSFDECKNFQKYEKQHKNNENAKTLNSKNGLNILEDNLPVYKNAHFTHNSTQSLSHNNNFVEKSHDMTDNSIFHSNSDSNSISVQRHNNQILQKNNAHRCKQQQHKKKVSASEIESNSDTQSEIVSTTQTRENYKSESASKASKSEAVAMTSSIAEELQKTYESQSHDNESTALNSKTKGNETKSVNKPNDSKKFIKSHINRGRGDFQENISKEAQFNETQFQQAIEASSQISSTEFGQSADDEITSSVSSQPCLEICKPSVRQSANQFPKTFSPPPQANARISIGGEIVKFFSQCNSPRSTTNHATNESMSETSLNYSNVGLYEKLIQNETNKSQHLSALLKMREKALLDRTKGQIAWLEVQKARYKAKGLINHIAVIKKKQRGILLKMEKEREEIKRLLYTTTNISKTGVGQTLQTEEHKINSQQNTPTKHKRERLSSNASPITKRKVLGQQLTAKTKNAQNSSPILRATYELESSWAVEELLKKREDDLRKRREHVERLIQWHQRLDEEEAEVLNLERQLLSYNNVPHMVEQQQPKLPTATTSAIKEKLTTPSTSTISATAREPANISAIKSPEKIRASRARKMEKRLKEIDKSLRELSHISASSTTSGVLGQTNNEQEDSVTSAATQELDFVRTTGLKLNKLWKRLTSQQIEKFESTRRYKLCKSDLERLYEEAKMAVLRDFAEDEERIAKELLEKTVSNISSTTTSLAAVQLDLPATTGDDKIIEVPMLNLNFSSGHSEAEEESANNSQQNAIQQGNYSPSVAEQNFKAQVVLNSSASSETISEQQMAVEEKQNSRLENNVQMFLALSQRMQAYGHHLQSPSSRHIQGRNRLQRSLSDTEISDVPTKYKSDKPAASQKSIETIASHSNSSITTNSSIRSFDAQAQHQRSKSSIVEITYIPSSATQTNNTDNIQGNKQTETQKDLEKINKLSNNQQTTLSPVKCSGESSITPIQSCQHTSSDIVTITEDTKTITTGSPPCLKQKSTYSGQVGTNSEITAKEISSKLDEISAAVTQLSQMNTLPSYESVTTTSHLKHKSLGETATNTNDESNLSTDGSSYSFNFDNITTDKHSSPGTSSTQFTLASKTFTKEEVSDQNETKDLSSAATSTTSKTYIKDDAKTSSKTLTQSMIENHILDIYEADFESDLSNVTHIEDITIPNFETTVETTRDDDDDDANEELSSKLTPKFDNVVTEDYERDSKTNDKTYNAEELRKTMSSPNSEKSLSKSDLKSQKHSPDRELLPPPPLPSPPAPSISTSTTQSTIGASNQTGSNHLMPDIINELELRRHQLLFDNEQLKQYEHVTAVPYMYVRQIPNKPPPPYVPPAHGSPMTTIFPSEDRIKDITFRRTQELYCKLLKTEYCNEKGEKIPSVMEEQITNIYERIILDICREYLEEHCEILQDGDPTNFHSQLAFFNPPNRLRCIQDAIYKEVRSCLAMDKSQPKRTQIYSVYGQRAKQDHIGKIIIQEMYDEDDRWCNFHREESEVLHLIVEEMINKNIVATAEEVFLQEGGTIDEAVEEVAEDQGILAEENAANNQLEHTLKFKQCLDEEKTLQDTQLQASSALMETLNENDQTYCISESKQEYAVLNETTRIETDHIESVKNTNIMPPINTVQTCT